MLAPSVRVLPMGDRVVLFSTRTGRWTQLDRESFDALTAGELRDGVRTRLERTRLLQDPEPAGLVPCRHRRSLVLPDRPALLAPDPFRPGPGGHDWRLVPLTAEELALLRACDGRTPLARIASKLGTTTARAAELAARFTVPELQVLQLRDAPARPGDPALNQLAGPSRPAHARTEDQRDARGATTLEAWHHRISSPERHFDDVETTVAHALALPHPALGGRSYGACLRSRLEARGFTFDGLVVEVGAGDGELAAAASGASRWVRLDLSPALLALQARAAPSTAGALADATRLPLRDASVPTLLSNEVLADLRAVPAGAGDAEVSALRARFGLPEEAPGGFDNLGAWVFVSEIARVLAPGGRAFLSEFGELDEAPQEAVQLDHPEVSVRFAPLVAIARASGLEAEVVRLDDVLGARLDTPQPSRASWEGLRALAALHGRHLPARAWTPETLPLPERVEGIEWVTLAEPGPGPLITRFQALLLRRPVSPAHASRTA